MSSLNKHEPSQALIPTTLLDSMLAAIGDLGDLRCILRALRTLDKQSEPLRYVTIDMLENDPVLQDLQLPKPSICSAMETATRVGLFEKRAMVEGEQEHIVFVLSTPLEVPAQHSIAEPTPLGTASVSRAESSNIFSLYESTVGMVTPFIADELKESEAAYPAHWIREAFNLAASLNKRNWRYIAAILNRWYAEEGQNGKPRRHIKTGNPKKYLAEYIRRRGGSFGE